MRGISKSKLGVSTAMTLIVVMGVVAFIMAAQGTQPLSHTKDAERFPMLFGVHEQYQNGPNETTPEGTKERYPMLMATREFKGGELKPQNLIPSLKRLCQPVWDAGLVCAVSYKFSRSEVLSGQWRPFIDQAVSWLRDMNRTSQTILIPWHEPENDFRNGPEFVAYFNIIHSWVKAVDPKLLTSNAAMAYHYRDRGKIGTDAKARQWKTRADIHSIDIYSGRSFPLDMTLGTSSAFNRWNRAVVGGSPWGVSERGWITGKYGGSAERVASITAEFDWLMSLDIEELPAFYIVWTTEGTENDPKIILDEAARVAVNEGFARLHEKITAGQLPSPTTPQPTEPSGEITCPMCHGDGKVSADVTSFSVTKAVR